MTESRKRLRDYCTLIQNLENVLKNSNMEYVLLKLYRSYEQTNYEPQDVDVFVGRNPRNILQILKHIKEFFPESKVKGEILSNPQLQILIKEHLLEIDLYLELLFSPIFILNKVPKDRKLTAIPWCKEIKIYSFSLPLDTLHILVHALRHKRLHNYEVLSLVEEIGEFDTDGIKNFILYVRKLGLESVILCLLKIVLYYSKFLLNISVNKYPLFYSNMIKLFKILAKGYSDLGLANYVVKLTLREASYQSIKLRYIFLLYVFRSFLLTLKNLSKTSIKALFTIIFNYFFYECIIGLFKKFKFIIM